MEINRTNYEEYFLLFADNELTDYEKIEVLRFIRENKDLEDEFIMIQDTVCKPDNTVMENKASLLRKSGFDFITEKNYEEIFVLYHDGELNDEEKRETELFFSRHPQLKKEFDLLKVVKIVPESSIIFSEKQSLYKKEKSGRVVPLIFWRLVAAAVFIGFGFWIFQAYYQPAPQLPGIVKNVNPVKKTEIASSKNSQENKNKPTESVVAKEDNRNKNVAEKEKSVYKKELSKHNVKVEKDEPSFVQAVIKNGKENDYGKEVPAENIDPDVAAVLQNKIKSMPMAKAIETDDISFNGDIEVKPAEKDNSNSNPVMQAQTASYISDANVKNENYVFYNITTEEFRKSKVGGFLKKVKRIVERSNPVTRLFSAEDKQVASN
ncbi:MAG: hypothetical protein ABI419_05315 [Ginsengibacter sp.]